MAAVGHDRGGGMLIGAQSLCQVTLPCRRNKGRTPWAIEIKVDIDRSGTGMGGYYRHAISQAVLYREFIRAGTPLHSWFTGQDLDAEECCAAVVVPDLTTGNARRDHRLDLQSICKLFDVELIEVDRQDPILR
jgi:hypothetical protein